MNILVFACINSIFSTYEFVQNKVKNITGKAFLPRNLHCLQS